MTAPTPSRARFYAVATTRVIGALALLATGGIVVRPVSSPSGSS
jgi:hypothetical protein